MTPVAIDNNILSGALLKHDDADTVSRCQTLLADLQGKGTPILLPLPAAMEFVTTADEAHQPNVWLNLKKTFQLAPFDLGAARIAALINRRISWRAARDVYKSESPDPLQIQKLGRQRVRMDILIVAIAEACGCGEIYTREHVAFEKLAAGLRIQVKDLPTRPSGLF
jgi:hypothetical protein